MLRAFALTLAILAGSMTAATAAQRVALVVGNGAYETLTPALPNPVNDAHAIADTLHGLGFQVDLVTDATKEKMEDALARLAQESRSAEVTLFFYAGHGLQDQGRNYLAPVDASLADETDLRRRFVRLDDVLDDLATANGARILLLDACRDNDAIEALRAAVPASRSTGVTRGLARIAAVEGQLVAFATQPDRVAADGDTTNSPFTDALVSHLGEPGIELRTALTRVRVDVAAATGNSQIPEVSDSLLGEIYLKPGDPGASGGGAPGGTTRTEPGGGAASEARTAWEAVKDTTSLAVLKAYVQRYGDSFYAELARARAAELQADSSTEEPTAPPSTGLNEEAGIAWNAVKGASSINMLSTFASRYPDSFYADLARARIAELEAERAEDEAARRAKEKAEQERVAKLLEAKRLAALEAERREQQTTPPGDWFVILGSFGHSGRQAAIDRQNWLRSQGVDASIINTDDYPNLRNGLYAVVLGPYSKSAAQSALPTAKRAVSDAYVKSGY